MITLAETASYKTSQNQKTHYILEFTRTRAFMWYTTYLRNIFSKEKRCLRVQSFGPFWAISTKYQWELTEVGRLDCFSDFLNFVNEHHITYIRQHFPSTLELK